MADPIEEVAKSNGFDPEEVTGFVGRVESVQSDIDEIMEEAKTKCAPLREDIATIKKEANDAGLPRKALHTVISVRRKLRRANMQVQNLDQEQQDEYELLQDALGDFGETELGFSALERARAE